MSWEMHEAAKKIADGWYSELEAARKRNAVLGRENAKLRELLIDVSEEVPWSFMDTTKYCMPLQADKLRKLLCRMRELGVDVEQ